MKIYLSPQKPNPSNQEINYIFENETIKAIYTYPILKEVEVTTEVDGIKVPVVVENEEGVEVPLVTKVEIMETLEELFDFSDIPDGNLEEVEIEVLPFNPIQSAERVNGELRVVLLNYIKDNVLDTVLKPEWIDTNDLVIEENGEGVVQIGKNEMEV